MDVGGRRFRVMTIVLAALFVLSAHAIAQEPTPAPGAAASSLLPGADVLGPGWTLDDTVSPDQLRPQSFAMAPDVFREGAVAIYVGPDGARIVIVALLLTESRVAIRQSWEDASELLDLLAADVSTDAQRTELIESLPPPTGCVEAKRAEGEQYMVLQPLGATMCAIDPDRILIVAVSGPWSNQEGVAASDATVARIAAGGGASATPAA